ncbi:hypothetical protein, partial [Victivallis vadensis]|uniref:hypothetical protein n=1 Tax=Victivallis vadensis TaxID=172901 RepID=UPI003AF9AA94
SFFTFFRIFLKKIRRPGRLAGRKSKHSVLNVEMIGFPPLMSRPRLPCRRTPEPAPCRVCLNAGRLSGIKLKQRKNDGKTTARNHHSAIFSSVTDMPEIQRINLQKAMTRDILNNCCN